MYIRYNVSQVYKISNDYCDIISERFDHKPVNFYKLLVNYIRRNNSGELYDMIVDALHITPFSDFVPIDKLVIVVPKMGLLFLYI